MKPFCFNTGNLYTEFGQRIGGAVLDDGSIVFYDVDRGVDGFIPPEFFHHERPIERVQEAYLRGGWTYWIRPESLEWEEYLRITHEAKKVALEAPSLRR